MLPLCAAVRLFALTVAFKKNMYFGPEVSHLYALGLISHLLPGLPLRFRPGQKSIFWKRPLSVTRRYRAVPRGVCSPPIVPR